MVRICRDQEGLISFSLLWLICDGRRLIIPRDAEKKEFTFIKTEALHLGQKL